MCKHVMMLLASLPILSAFVGAQTPPSAAPVIRDVSIAADDPRRVHLVVAWPNAWRTERNHDAAWVVLRGPDARHGLLRLAAEGHTATSGDGAAVALQVADDGVGMFVAPGAAHRGDVSYSVSIRLVADAPQQITAWAVGMVYVPAGGFQLGDDVPLHLRYGAFHGLRKDGDGALVPVPYDVHDEREVVVAKQPGSLWYDVDENRYRGDAGGPIPSSWPKGTRAFYVMKHELRQGAYAAFLSALPRPWQQLRAPLQLEGEETATCSIVRAGDGFVASAPERPCNFVSWDDTCAWLDWMGLRPMTEFEFEKAARGPSRPVAGDYPWGTADDSQLQRTVTKTRDLKHSGVADERSLDDASKARHGASFYWVMDLSGSVWERVISAGHEVGRQFLGSHGDGVLSEGGGANNADWPKTVGRAAPGVGYRGGAEYFKPKKVDDPTNPHSPIAVRTYGGWGGAQRYKTYSARGSRTAPVGRE